MLTEGDRLKVARRVLIESDIHYELLDILRRGVERDYPDGSPLFVAEVMIVRADLHAAYQDALYGTRHTPPPAPADGPALGNDGAPDRRNGGAV